MSEIQVISTSATTADCDPIILRSTDRVRLVFVPTMVDNTRIPAESVRGTFVYQKKNKTDKWVSVKEHSLASLKSGEGYKLELHCGVWSLMQSLGQIYRLHRQEGIPRGQHKFVKIEAALAPFLALGQVELMTFLEDHSQNAAEVLLKLIQWLSHSRQGISALSKMSASELPSITAFLGLSTIKSAANYWLRNESNDDEEFWQKALSERAYVLSQAFSYPVVIIKSKAYLGGKTFDDTGGKLVDFLLATESTKAAMIVEIKTPKTELLGPKYRGGVFPFSQELSGAIAQSLSYKRSFSLAFQSLTANSSKKLLLGEPRCLVIAGNTTAEFTNDEMRESFELQRERLQGVTVIGYDELFLKVQRLIDLLEKPAT